MPTTLPPFPDDLAKLASADLARLVSELRAENAQLRAELGQLPSASQSLLDDQLRRISLLTQLAIEFREVIGIEQIVEQTLRALAAHLVAGASIILVGPGRQIELASTAIEGGVQPIAPDLAREVVEKGLAGWVVRHGSSVALMDVARDRRWLQFSEQHRSGSVIVIPIRQANVTLGVLTAHRPAVNAFSSHDLIMLEGVSAQLGVALSAARYQASERVRRDQAMTLLVMTQFLSAERSLAELAAMLNEKGAAVFGARWGILFLIDGDDYGTEATLHPVLPGPAAEWAGSADLAGGAAQMAWAGQRIVTTAPVPDMTCVALPLTHHGLMIGSFVLVHDGKCGFSATLWSLLTVFTHIVAAACANVQLVGRLTGQASALERLVEQRTRQMQGSRDALRVVFDSLPDGVILLDSDETLLAANQFFCAKIVGLHPRDLVGQSYAHVWQLLERQPHVQVTLMPGQEAGHQQMTVRIGDPPSARTFTVRRSPVDGEAHRVEQHLEFWIMTG
ncbi:GAF domain-containing protein [Oscillochloris sp. ZM17-4]|uniref:GAF domain-containing protein n=1 Tax=Oscillochloris sp. ZM17-4 TaxID=2866714 RepID=UPI001C739E5A|nr:GAF domain-containing protein [Oscillochloris sp. ZM17-4]MBX0329257.1 GAF domain-containing protein [Oscillochloris sp. ZM17-4]